jgi:hypothetical protein
MRRALALLVPLLVLLPAAPAAAVWVVPADTVAGPTQIVRVGDATLGPDGTGAVAFIQRIGSRKHRNRDRVAAVVRIRGGRWGHRAIVARGGVGDVRAAAGGDGRLAVVWSAGGTVWGTAGGHGALAAPVQLGGGNPAGLDVRLGGDGDGYAVWSQDGPGGRDVRAAQLTGNKWTPIATPLDADPARSAAGVRVTVRADGAGVAAWVETFPDGSTHVFARRLGATDAPPVQVDVPTFGTDPGGSADSPDLDAESGPGAAWIAFREDVAGHSRTLARRLTDAGPSAPVALDGGAPSRNPAIAVGGENGGVAAVGTDDGRVLASRLLPGGTFAPPVRVDFRAAAAPPAPVASWAASRGVGAVAYRAPASSGDAAAFGVLAEQGRLLPPGLELSRKRAGPVVAGSLRSGTAPTGDAVVAMLQGAKKGHRRLTVALLDRAPEPPTIAGPWVTGPHPVISWTPGVEAFGSQRFTVTIDGRVIGRTRASSLRSSRAFDDGRHRVRVTARDQRGQDSTPATRTVRLDSTDPKVTITPSRSGRVLRLAVRRSDTGSGVAAIDVRWGDGETSSARRGPFRHRYATTGARHVRVTVRDRAGNRTVRRLTA